MINKVLADKIKETTKESIRLKELAFETDDYKKSKELQKIQGEIYNKKNFFKKLKSAIEEEQRKDFEERRMRSR